MKRICITMVAMLLGFAAMAQGLGTLSCADVTANTGEVAYLEVKLNTEDATAISGIQFNFTLPDGVVINQNWNEDDEEWINDIEFPIAKSKHQVGIKETAGGGYMVFLGGETSLSFKTTTTTVAKIGIKVGDNKANGVYDINFVKATMSDKSSPVKSNDVADFTAKLTVSSGAEQPSCTFSAEDIEAVAGGETAYLEVKLATEDVTAISGIQFSFSLPEGVSIAQYENGEGELEDDVTFPIAKKSHQVGIKATSDGKYLVYLGGETSLSFKTTTDVVARIGLAVAKTVKGGTYAINFMNVVVSDKSKPVKSYDVADFTAKLAVTGAIEPDSDDTDISKLNNVIYLEKTEAYVGSTATLSFKMKNTADIRGFGFDLCLPEGVTAVKDAMGRIQGSLSDGRCLLEDDEHPLSISELADGVIRFLCDLGYNESFTGKEGEIATLQVNIAGNMADGDYAIELKDMRLSETDISKYYDTEYVKSTLAISSYLLGDINHDRIVNVSDYIGVANHILGSTPSVFNEKAADVNKDNIINVSDYIGVANIIMTGSPYGNTNHARPAYARAKDTDISTMENVIYVESITANAGTQATLSFIMKNSVDIRGFQFDLYLPEAVTVVKNAKGRIQGSLSDERKPEDDEHTLTISEQDDGAIRFLCGSQYDETFTGNDGQIATLQVNIAEDAVKGDYPITLKTMRLSESDISKYYDSDNVESTITIVGGVGIADILEGSNTRVVIYNLAGQRLAKPQQGMNIVNGKKIIIK